MDSPDDEATVVNIKNVRVNAYRRAKTCANRTNESMGEWCSRAFDQLANLEEGGRHILPPARGADLSRATQPANLVIPTAEYIQSLASLVHAMAAAKLDMQKRNVAKLNAVLYTGLRAAEGKPVVLGGGQDVRLLEG